MNFFRHQEKAKFRTTILIVMLIIAVCFLVALASLAVAAFIYFFADNSNLLSNHAFNNGMRLDFSELIYSPRSFWVAVLVILAVFLGSLYKWIQMKQGGKVVAESLGGRLVSPDTENLEERKVLNIVEEMAIASGNPVPSVYLIEDPSINAFAAGHTRRDAVIGVTRGCIHVLNRAELQGVIAHEFSHIHNGDMRLNMKLISILHGILLIGLIGYHVSRGGSVNSRRGGTGAVIGLAFIAIGYGGTFFGNIIKAAVSRQREFLADASAVQFTRDPNGISGALKKIGGHSQGSVLSTGAAAEFSHMLFGQGIQSSFSGLMATHPPIIERIKRIDPKWDGSYETFSKSAANTEQVSPQNLMQTFDEVRSKYSFEEQALNFIGEPQPYHDEAAFALIQSIPEQLRVLGHNAFSARAAVYALLMDKKEKVVRAEQLESLKKNAHPATYREMEKCLEIIDPIPRSLLLTLIDICLPAIKQLSEPQYTVFKKNLVLLIQADNKVSLFEWSVYQIIVQNYETIRFEPKFKLNELTEDIGVLFSLVVYAGNNSSPGGAFKAAIDSLPLKKVSFTLSDEAFNLKRVDKALENLCCLKPLQKPILLKAIAAIVTYDGEVTITEAELYRAIGDTLDCPIPPIIV